jgi:hypothetical protein
MGQMQGNSVGARHAGEWFWLSRGGQRGYLIPWIAFFSTEIATVALLLRNDRVVVPWYQRRTCTAVESSPRGLGSHNSHL